MQNQDKYSLDELLLSKPYAALSMEEKHFVATCDTTPEAYEQLRQSALLMQEAFSDESDGTSGRLKKNVMAAFDAHHRPAKKAIIFWKSQRNWYNQPLFRIAVAATLVGVIWLVSAPEITNDSKELLSENTKPKIIEQKLPPAVDDSALSRSDNPESEISAEPLQSQSIVDEPENKISKNFAQSSILEKPNSISSLAEKHVLDSERGNPEVESAEASESAYEVADAGSPAFDSTTNSTDEVHMPSRMQSGDARFERAENTSSTLSKISKSAAQAPAVSFKLSDRIDWKKDHYTAY